MWAENWTDQVYRGRFGCSRDLDTNFYEGLSTYLSLNNFRQYPVELLLESVSIKAKPRRLKAKWVVETSDRSMWRNGKTGVG